MKQSIIIHSFTLFSIATLHSMQLSQQGPAELTKNLFKAIGAKNHTLVQKLIDEGADVNKSLSSSGQLPPLAVACGTGDKKIVDMLLQHNADPIPSSMTPLSMILSTRNESLANYFLNRLDTDKIDQGFFYTCAKGLTQAARTLLVKCPDLSKNATTNKTPLAVALENKHISIANLLITRNFNISTTDSTHKTALFSLITELLSKVNSGIIITSEQVRATVLHHIRKCAKNEQAERRAMLNHFYYLFDLETFQDVIQLQEEDDFTIALYHAVHTDFLNNDEVNFEKIELLDAIGADPSKTILDKSWSAMHFACQHGLDDVVELFIASGADIYQLTEESFTPHSLACTFKHEKIIELIREKNLAIIFPQ